ncbi:DUF3048 domain-containing protein [Virgibacillus ainsalahensis]
MRKIVYLLLGVMMLLMACSDEKITVKDNESKENNVVEKTKAPDIIEVQEDISHVYPLTGTETNEDVDNRMIGVMVNNHTDARPQTGLSKADIVFEILAEGNITRLLALYQSDIPEVVGPVRSAREYYFELANGYNAMYVYHGAAGFINDMIEKREIDHLNGSNYDNNGPLFNRESFRQAPHNSYLQTSGVYPEAEAKGYDISANHEPMTFTEKDAQNFSGEEANHVEIIYGSDPMEIVEFYYDTSSETYTRYNDREKTVELSTGDPIRVDNIFIVETDHEVIDNAGRRDVDLTSGGNAYLIRKGNIEEVQWENRDGRIIPVKDGEPAGFVPGKTWINIIPSNPGINRSVTVSK